MIRLQDSFRQDGFSFRILQRHGRVALLVKHKPGHRAESFEVVIIQKRGERQAFGVTIPATESLPQSEAWGRLGWTFTSREKAEQRFLREVMRRRKAPQC